MHRLGNNPSAASAFVLLFFLHQFNCYILALLPVNGAPRKETNSSYEILDHRKNKLTGIDMSACPLATEVIFEKKRGASGQEYFSFHILYSVAPISIFLIICILKRDFYDFCIDMIL